MFCALHGWHGGAATGGGLWRDVRLACDGAHRAACGVAKGGTVPRRTKRYRARVRSTQGSTKYKGASRPGLLCRAGAPDFCTNVYLLHHSTSFLTLPKLPRKRCCRLPRRRKPPLVLNGCAKRTRRSSDMVHLNQEVINLFIKWFRTSSFFLLHCCILVYFMMIWW